MKISFRSICEGELMPPFYYGLAYTELFSCHYVFYPFPLNHIIRFFMFTKMKWNRFRSKIPFKYDSRVAHAIRYWKRISYQDGIHYGEKRAIRLLRTIIYDKL